MNVPKLRLNNYIINWEHKNLNFFAEKITQKNRCNKIGNVITNSSQHGLIPQREYFDKDIANKNNVDGYYVISHGDFVYNPRISQDSPYGPVNLYNYPEVGIVSPLYLCFNVKGIDARFLSYYFKTSRWYRHLYIHGDSGARHDRVSIRDTDFFNMPLSYPSLEEQQKIASFFSLLDQKIGKQQEKVEQLELFKKGMMQKIFTQEIRFKDENGQEFPEWEEKKFSQVAELINGRAYKQDELLSVGKYPVLRVGNFFTSNEWYFSDLELPDDKYARTGDLLYAWSASFGPRIWTGDKVIYHYHIWKITLYENINKHFLYNWLSYDANKITSQQSGSTMFHITKKSMEERHIMLPVCKEQQKIASYLSLIDSKIKKETEKLTSLTELKKGFMQQMFI